jgi:ADP-ribose pyrophosphatase
MLRLLASTVRETDDGEARDAVLEMRFDLDLASVKADQGMGNSAREHRPKLGGRSARVCVESAPKEKTSGVDAWRKLDERLVYDRFRRVLSKRFELPDGNLADFEVFELLDSATVLALTASSEVVLVREFRPGPEAVLLELPGGVVEPGQAPVDAARAELREETGYEGELLEVGTVLKDAYATNVKHLFASTECRPVAAPELPRLTQPVLMPLPAFREHLRGGRLTDTDAAYRALDFLGLL